MRRLMLTGLAAIILLGTGLTAQALPIEQAELPPVVQETVLNEAGSTALKRIEVDERGGRLVYTIVWQLGSTDIAILVDRDGTVLDKVRRPAE